MIAADRHSLSANPINSKPTLINLLTSENSNQPQILNKKRNYNSERRPSSSKFRKTPSPR
ncbi:hypothetical protein PGT21_008395 [Puccinia graminis f. sp. tritici]|uniref:Uncharacterized protein n=1 Tax=Puccinia graminis f. sp. tritici TaxID=56615 RepID=A0A5B0MTZ1_PUCGR|nr:hypothetical protein PGT21_008395 [Puccinia graminis f. sp. tritici]